MKIYRLLSTLLAIIVLACLFGVQGQLQVTPSNGYSTAAPPSAAQNPLQYSQSYTMSPVSAHISAPVKTAIVGKTPVPYSNTIIPYMWIQGTGSWAQVPQGATVTLLAISPAGANGYLSEILNGATYNSNFYFYPNNQLTFYADTIGQHTLSFSVNGQSSNQVVIDVVGGTYTQPSNNPVYTQPTNYPGYYPWNYYPGYYVPSPSLVVTHGRGHRGGHAGGHTHTGGKGGHHPHP